MGKLCKWNSDKKIICVQCKERPAFIKLSHLCIRCHYQEWKVGYFKLYRIPDPEYQHRNEMIFGRCHSTFIYQPATFYLDNAKQRHSYTPDFYDPIKNEFYEIIGSRQRFEQLKHKLQKFHELYPNIVLNICNSDGELYHSTKNYDLVSDLAQA